MIVPAIRITHKRKGRGIWIEFQSNSKGVRPLEIPQSDHGSWAQLPELRRVFRDGLENFKRSVGNELAVRPKNAYSALSALQLLGYQIAFDLFGGRVEELTKVETFFREAVPLWAREVDWDQT